MQIKLTDREIVFACLDRRQAVKSGKGWRILALSDEETETLKLQAESFAMGGADPSDVATARRLLKKLSA